MATAGGVVSRSACQGLLRTVARPQARSRLLVRRPRWISSAEQARPDQLSSPRLGNVKEKDRWLLEEFGRPFKTVNQKSIMACEEPVRLVDSKIECLCSWNQASGSRQAIYVPGDASRPRKLSMSLSNPATRESLAPASSNRPWGYCNPGRGPRDGSWDDPLAALVATDPKVNLDHVDVMVSDEVLLHLLSVAQNGPAPFFGEPLVGQRHSQVFSMLLIGNTLVIKLRPKLTYPENIRVPAYAPYDWEYYKAATESVSEVEDSSVHHQLLRYKFGPLSCLLQVRVHGTVQEMPASTSSSQAPHKRNLHGIDVIRAGQGVDPTFAFQAITRPISGQPFTEGDTKRLRALTARVWFSGQTRLGFADVVPADQVGELGRLTVVDMTDLVRHYEELNQEGLRRVVGLLETLRWTVRAHGAPCIGIDFPPSITAMTRFKKNRAIHVFGAGPDEAPVLLDWHKEHFWSEKGRTQPRPRRKNVKGQSQPQGIPNAGQVDEPKSFIRKWAQWLRF